MQHTHIIPFSRFIDIYILYIYSVAADAEDHHSMLLRWKSAQLT